MKILLWISRLLSSQTSLFIILVAVLTFFEPELFRWVKGDVQTGVLGVIMLTMGMTLTPEDFRILARRPLDIFLCDLPADLQPQRPVTGDAVIQGRIHHAEHRQHAQNRHQNAVKQGHQTPIILFAKQINGAAQQPDGYKNEKKHRDLVKRNRHSPGNFRKDKTERPRDPARIKIFRRRGNARREKDHGADERRNAEFLRAAQPPFCVQSFHTDIIPQLFPCFC